MTNFDKVKEQWKFDSRETFGGQICNVIRKIRGIKSIWDCQGMDCNECKKWLQQEYKEPILDDVERKYLSTVIKPFRNEVENIEKIKVDDETDRICIGIYGIYNDIFLPPFDEGTMYRGMKYNVYTLEELGL